MIEESVAIQLEHVRVRVLPDGRMTRRDAAIYLGVRPKTLAMWALQGKGPAVIHIGRRAYYTQAALDLFIASGRRGVTSSSRHD